MEKTGINYTHDIVEKRYCQEILQAEIVNTCEVSISVDITIPNYYLKNPIAKFSTKETSCISRCFENRHCLAEAYVANIILAFGCVWTSSHLLARAGILSNSGLLLLLFKNIYTW